MVACVFEDTEKGLYFQMNDDRISDAKLKIHMNRRKQQQQQQNKNKKQKTYLTPYPLR